MELINIAQKLMHTPDHTKLYSPLFGELVLERLYFDRMPISEDIRTLYKEGACTIPYHFDKYGRWRKGNFTSKECMLFPPKEAYLSSKNPWGDYTYSWQRVLGENGIMATELIKKLQAAVADNGDKLVINSPFVPVAAGMPVGFVVYTIGTDFFQLE